MDIYNEKDLTKAIKDDLRQIAIEISDRLRDIVKYNVKTIVYDPYKPEMYKRKREAGGFLGSWIHDNIAWDTDENGFSSTIFSDPDLMDLDPPSHGSMNTNQRKKGSILSALDADRRNEMDAMIAIGYGYDYVVPGEDPSNNWWTRPRDYWSPSLDTIDGGLLDVATDMSFSKRNIQFTKI
jgi:hypothetical protein